MIVILILYSEKIYANLFDTMKHSYNNEVNKKIQLNSRRY